jgi:hypothetical protein
MNFWMPTLVAGAYTSSVIAIHRLSLWHRRKRGQGYRSLAWLDWHCLVDGLWKVLEGQPAETVISSQGASIELTVAAAGEEQKRKVIVDLVKGVPCSERRIVEAGFTESDLVWVSLLAQLKDNPDHVIAQLEHGNNSSLRYVYLYNWIELNHQLNGLNLEWKVFQSKVRLGRALDRLGEQAPLYFLRAQAAAELGQNSTMVDELARAVYFSREARFYLEAVQTLELVREERPALFLLCEKGLERVQQ